MGAWGNEAEIHLQEIWFTQACGIPSRQNEQSNLPTFLDHSRKQHLLSSRQEGLTACAEEPPWCTAGWGGCQHLLKGNIVFQHLESEPSEEIKSTDTSPPSGEQRSTAIISKRVWNTEMTFCFVWNLERQSASFSKPGGRSKIFLKNGTNISCKRTLPYSFKQREMWRAPSLTPIIHITKKKKIFFSPLLMSYLLCTCLPLLIPQLLNNLKSRIKNHDECHTQKQFMAIFNFPFGFLSPWDSFCSYFQGFLPSNHR